MRLSLFLLCVLPLAAPAAPVPPPRAKAAKAAPAEKAKAPPFVGAWRMTWGASEGDAVFSKDGGYWCLWAGQQWLGGWTLKAGVLTVREGRVPQGQQDGVPGPPLVWSVKLTSGGLSGEASHDGRALTFRLRSTLPAPQEDRPDGE